MLSLRSTSLELLRLHTWSWRCLQGLGRFSWQGSRIFLRSQFQRLCRLRPVLANHHNWLPSFKLDFQLQLENRTRTAHRVIEQSGLEGTFKDHLAHLSCTEQGHLQLDPVAQSPVQPAPTHHSSGQSVLVVHHHHHHKKCIPSIYSVFTLFPLKPLSLVLLQQGQLKSLPQLSYKLSSSVLQGFSEAFSSPSWRTPTLSAFLHRRGAPSLWSQFLQLCLNPPKEQLKDVLNHVLANDLK